MPQVRTLTPDGPAIRARRLEMGLTPTQVGDRIHRHSQTIRRLERGAITTASETLIHQVARALETTAEVITRSADVAA